MLVVRATLLGKLNRIYDATPVVEKLIETNPDIKEIFYPWLIDIGWDKTLVWDIADGLAKAGLVVDLDSTVELDGEASADRRAPKR